MGFILLLIMIAVPIGEIAVFIQAGDILGLWVTLGTVVLTAMIGTAFLRLQGLGVVRRVQESLARGEMPVGEMFDGLCLLLAGALLLTPGFITDSIGFVLLIPPLRRAIAAQIALYLLRSGRVATWPPGGSRRGGDPGGAIIDGEFEHVETREDDSDHPDPTRRIKL